MSDTGGDKTKTANRITVRPETRPSSSGQSAASPEEAGLIRGTLISLTDRIEKLAAEIDKSQLREYMEMTHRPWQLIWRNLVSGLFRGVGIALGFTFFAATIVWILQILGKLNLPVVGDYIADIVRIVQRQLQINPY